MVRRLSSLGYKPTAKNSKNFYHPSGGGEFLLLQLEYLAVMRTLFIQFVIP
ncbi:hypothetical protein HMPREF0204_14764 [Chryseobacterium gleum ATCC 35910]|uniref:Uncharacterized protein n=1 Tax=Chryseobacterium gleum ATCC 35910 TaxID=525257 RepID=A0ABN0ARL0_CHRGE|nr:hypothetical protein HMPREF0204_14764 [Chryseobacterium gleum ATCC 35910]